MHSLLKIAVGSCFTKPQRQDKCQREVAPRIYPSFAPGFDLRRQNILVSNLVPPVALGEDIG